MRGLRVLVAATAVVTVGQAMPSQASIIQLAADGLYLDIDGTVSTASPQADLSGFDLTSGLGTIFVTVHGAGAHFVGVFVDHEIDQTSNGFANEVGLANGLAAAGQSWEIDEPGYAPPFGNIFSNFAAGTLDNTNASTAPNDVSMALGWSFTLDPTTQGSVIVSFLLGTAPVSGFSLQLFDPDSAASVYFSSSLAISPLPPTPIPVPSSLAVLLGGLIPAMIAFWRRAST